MFLCNLGVGSEGTVGFSEPAQFCLECGQEVRFCICVFVYLCICAVGFSGPAQFCL